MCARFLCVHRQLQRRLFFFWLGALVSGMVRAQTMATPRWGELETPKADSILGLKAAYLADEAKDKMEVTIGAYRTAEGKPWVLPAVELARAWLAKQGPDWTHEYLPIEGHAGFLKGSEGLLYGEAAVRQSTQRIASAQALSGTGAVRLVLEFFKRHWETKTLYLPATTWANHWNIARDAGFESPKPYRYLSGATAHDAEGMLEDLKDAPRGSLVLLHLCAHNPSGVDPSPETWARIADVFAERGLVPIFDSAYLGFASGDVDRDAFAFRLFVEKGLQPWACVSFSKNFGLYSERVGAVHATVSSLSEEAAVLGHLKKIARAMYSNPPAFGAKLVARVLEDPTLATSWRASLKDMADRISAMRALLRSKLEVKLAGTPYSDWAHVTSQIGMFSFTGLQPRHAQALRRIHHVYLLDNGRVSMAGLNEQNIDRFADAVADVLLRDLADPAPDL